MADVPITVYGDVDARAVDQLRRCAEAGDALRGALCADGHVGYSQPIGGAVAYADHISPSGVGYDIACLAAGSRVTSADGYWKPIEDVVAGEAVLGWDTSRLRVVAPCDGGVARGSRVLRRVKLALGRELLLTDDHRVRTRLGWKRADELRPGDAVACSPFVGLPFDGAWEDGARLSALVSADDGTFAELRLAQQLLDALDFDLRIASGMRLRGAEAELLRYEYEIGYSRSAAKRVLAAARLSAAAARAVPIAVGANLKGSDPFRFAGEVAWLPVLANEQTGTTGPVYDVVTGDPAGCFLASGIVVHNCGNKAARTNLRADDIRADLSGIMDSIFSRISFGVGRQNDEPVDHGVLDAVKRADFAPQRQLYDLAAKQLGTVGAGNHYVDLFEDEDGWVWIGVHFGSRGFGHRTASGFLALAQGLPFDGKAKEGEMDSPPVLFHVDSELGRSYIAAMSLAGEYAYAGRDTVVAKVLEILGAEATESVHNHHNFGWRERHFDTDVWVIRKGCTPAFPGQVGFVGATMGEPSVILRGSDSGASRELLYSTVHGAGRVMSRTKAAGKLRTRAECSVRDCDFDVSWKQRHEAQCPDHPGASFVKRRRIVEPGLIDFAAVQSELRGAGIELRGGAADEAPGAYKRLDAVLAAHGDTIEVVHRLMPLGVAMAGADTFDPYKD